jgi:PKD repeat protein
MTGDDYDGVQCDFCHALYDPFFETTYAGTREGNDWLNYWDETNGSGTPSQPAATTTHSQDAALAQTIDLFNGNPFYVGNLPFSPYYTENAGGQYFVSGGGQKRAPFADATARHTMAYSRYHKSRYFCSTCHDVSNPVLANLAFEGTPPFTYTRDLGDGTAAGGVTVTHIYTAVGLYTVTLTATNPCGSDRATHAVIVSGWRVYLPLVQRE